MARRRMTPAELAALQRPPVKRATRHSSQQARRAATRPPAPLETDECRTFIAWTRLVHFMGEPLFERVVKIPNERGKAGAAIAVLESIGLRSGFPDYSILAPAGRWHGLYLEAKRIDGSTIDGNQVAWRDKLLRWGYDAVICEGAAQLIQATKRYFSAAGAYADGSFVDGTSISA